MASLIIHSTHQLTLELSDKGEPNQPVTFRIKEKGVTRGEVTILPESVEDLRNWLQ
jgi:hypothetical protein